MQNTQAAQYVQTFTAAYKKLLQTVTPHVTICDEALGYMRLHVSELYAMHNNTYAFASCEAATCLQSGTTTTEAHYLSVVADFALEEGYVCNNVSEQCKLIYDATLLAAYNNNTL